MILLSISGHKMSKTKEETHCICCKKRNSKQICRECRLRLKFLETTLKQPLEIPLIEAIVRYRSPKNVIDYIISLGDSIKTEREELLHLKICPLCQKPHKRKVQLCGSCSAKNSFLTKQSGKKFSIATLLYIKQKYQLDIDELFSILANNNWSLDFGNHQSRLKNKRECKEFIHSNISVPFEKEIKNIPDYVLEFFKKNKEKTLLYLNGQRFNPLVVYKCNKCGKEIAVRWENILKGHNCEAIKSSGEAIVEKYLNSFFEIKTQRDTLPCRNPLTKHIMPYDIEIPSKKIIIEIQGEQHLNFIPYFHITEENFRYQKYKDRIKKEYAESCGYKMIYLFYDDIKSGKFKDLLADYLS